MPEGDGDDDGEYDQHHERPFHHVDNHDHIDVGHPLKKPVEPAVEQVGMLFVLRFQPKSALDGFQGKSVDGAYYGSCSDNERKLAKYLPGYAREKGGGQENRNQGKRDSHDRAGQFAALP